MPMSPPKAHRGPRAALLTAAAGLLLPGALAAQQPSSGSLLSLDHPHRAPPPVRLARHVPAGPLDHGRFRAFRMSDGAIGDAADPAGIGIRAASPVLTRVATAEPSSVLDAMLAVAGPADEREEDDAASLGSLGDVLPRALTRDLLELRARIRRYRTVLFGQRGIVRWGTVDGDERRGRIRLNLQADPDPGLRVTLVTR